MSERKTMKPQSRPFLKRPAEAARIAFFLSLLLSLSRPVLADTLTVAVAANVQYAFEELQAEFKKETGHDIKPIYSSSGKFAAQILNGAPFDVFLSADMEYPQTLYLKAATYDPPRVYAYGTLVLWTMKDVDLSKWQRVLTDPATKHIAIANPRNAPYGREAYRVLEHYKLQDAVKPKVVLGESISQTNQYIHSKAADIGFTAKSVVLSPEMKDQGKWIDLPPDSYEPIAQGVVILKHGQATIPKASQQFYDFLFSTKARAIFQRYGYALP
jgi:molybdate transport system substrate-binding protein